jgi:hypothetical protein
MTAAETVLEKPPASSAPPAESASTTGDTKRPYPPPAETPTQAGPLGIWFDYNDGCRSWPGRRVPRW